MGIEEIRNRGGVEILKASAGSGKTYNLAKEYIRLLLSDGSADAHRHILAVTFTNKATAEMKERILKELDILSKDPSKSNYTEELLHIKGMDSTEILRQKAGAALAGILRDYSGFSVSTIDKFFQQALRAFAREAGEFREYQIELDKDSLVSETVDRVLDSLSDKDTRLLKWLSDSSMESLESGEGYHLESRLSEFATDYSKESFKTAEEQNGIDREKGFSEENLKRLSTICRTVIKDYDTALLDAHREFLADLDGLEDLNRYLAGYMEKLMRWKPGDEIPVNTSGYWVKSLDDGSAAFTAKGRKRYGDAVFDKVSRAVNKLNSLWGLPLQEMKTAVLLKGQISMFRVASAIDREFKELLKEKNILSIDVTNTILNDIIGGTDAPFIYEKLGVRYSHFLLDEFQDTSRIQWDNFRPLLANSIAEGCFSLIVGDVKQSIYRWRDADWEILNTSVGRELDRTVEEPLKYNYRSAGNIVSFNNAFFHKLALEMDRSLNGGNVVAGIYSDVKQGQGKDKGVPGSVELSFCDTDELFDKSVEAVADFHENGGFAYRDIAVIVRTNAMGSEIAARLVKNGIPIVSNDSLHIGTSPCVKRLVSELYLIDNPDEKVKSFYAGDFDREAALAARTLPEMAAVLISGMDKDDQNRDTLYLLAFMDMVRDFMAKNGNSLHSFLKYWEQEGIVKSISSPEGSDAVTIITVHKVKGLDYPCIVLPVPKKSGFVSGMEKSWECPYVEGSKFSEVEKMLYSVKMTQGLKGTLFSGNYDRNATMAFIDSINLWYVAMTRASEAMHIISILPSKEIIQSDASGDWPEINNFSAALYLYAQRLEKLEEWHFIFGERRPALPKEDKDSTVMEISFADASGESRTRAELKIRDDADQFFSDKRGELSRRTRGTVLHGILQNVCRLSDLKTAVRGAVMSGELDAALEDETLGMLSSALERVAERGWFPENGRSVLQERDIVDKNGEIRRPDRIVFTAHGVDVIDYKFGKPDRKYLKQVSNYVGLCRALGWKDVNGYVWYVESGEIVPAEQ